MKALFTEVADAITRLENNGTKSPAGIGSEAASRKPQQLPLEGLSPSSTPPPAPPQTKNPRERVTPKVEKSRAALPEEEERDRRPIRGLVRKPGPLKDTPQKRVYPLKEDVYLEIDEGASLAAKYEAAIRALIKDMKRKGAGSKQVTLENGACVQLDGSENGYEFPYEGENDLFEGAGVNASVGTSRSEGKIVAVQSGRIIISLEENYGPRIAVCILRVDNTAMLEALRTRLDKIEKNEVSGFNLELAQDAVFNTGDAHPPTFIDTAHADKLNHCQKQALGLVLANSVSYIWGPPGTGKTFTLGRLCSVLFNEKQRVLLCSNTNQAVDQVLLKLCKEFTKSHSALINGEVVRVGKISHQELESDWFEYVAMEGITERKSKQLLERKAALEVALDKHNKAAARASEILRAFVTLDGLLLNRQSLETEVTGLNATLGALNLKKQEYLEQAQKLSAEMQKVESSGAFLRLLKRPKEQIQRELDAVNSSLKELGARLPGLEFELRRKRESLAQVKVAILNSKRLLAAHDRAAVELQFSEAEGHRKPLLAEISALNKQLEDIRKTIVEQARIVGSTVTKAYLSPQLFSNFDVVIIDEASMGFVPALYHAAGLAGKKVVISGDFRQLAPIVQTDQKAIVEIIGDSIFDTTKISTNEPEHMQRVQMLEEQYRMDESICSLINRHMYDERLKTAPARESSSKVLPPPFNARLTIIDTSSIGPFVNRDIFGSRYNLMNSLAIRNICWHLKSQGLLQDLSQVGVCTPYSAQAKVLNRILSGTSQDTKVTAGTIHRYQGDEKSLMVLDIPDSYGEPTVGMFLEAEGREDNGCRLFNVALSRAKEQVIFVANLAYLDAKLPAYAFLREILSTAQERGVVLDVRDVLALYPIVDDLRTFGSRFDLSSEALHSGLYNQQDFEKVFVADLESAKKGILIYSGFVTPQRVAMYEAVFRRKLAQGVKIRCVTRPPKKNGSIPLEQGKEALDGLERMGCIVDTRSNIHEKFGFIDGETIWWGSLNPLSYTSQTSEAMARMVDTKLALQVASFLAIEKNSRPDAAEGFLYQSENPRCPKCNSRTSLSKGRFGPYWACEECTWTESFDKPRTAQHTSEPPPDGPTNCEKCGAKMVLREGKFGQFFGCSNYPKCTHIVNPSRKKQKQGAKSTQRKKA